MPRPNIQFKLSSHEHRDSQVVEVWLTGQAGDQLIACVYPADYPGVRIMSKHMTAENTVVATALPRSTDGDEFPVGIVSVTLRRVDP